MRLSKRTSQATVGQAFLGLVLILASAPAQAADLVVVEARGIGLQIGQPIDPAKPLVLKEGQHVTLINSNGATIKLDGPYNNLPTASQNGGSGPVVLAALMTQNQARTSEIGATRGAAPVAKLPDPWVLDVSRTGNVCLVAGHTAQFWRPTQTRASLLAVMPSDRSWKSQAHWPAGSDRLPVTTQVPLRGGDTYFVTLDGNEAAMTVNAVPAVLDTKAMRVAWMANKGCEAQAEALLRSQ
jgi:hypothetical protein